MRSRTCAACCSAAQVTSNPRSERLSLLRPPQAFNLRSELIAENAHAPGLEFHHIAIDGVDCTRLSSDRRTQMRRTRLGFVYQFHHLLPEFSALENVMLPQMIADVPRAQARDQARALLKTVGLAARESHRPARLSGTLR